MALTLSGTNGIVGAGFTVDNSGVSVTAGVGTFSSLNAAASGLHGALPALNAASLTQIPAANLVGVCTSGLTRTGGFGGGKILQVSQTLDTSDYSTTGSSFVQGPQTATFTLSNSSNKVLVLCNWMAFMDARSGGTVNVGNAIYRGSVASGSQISLGGQPMQYFGNTFSYEYYGGHCFLQYLDTPSGNTTYSLAVRNITGSNSAQIRGTQQTTSITLMEIEV